MDDLISRQVVLKELNEYILNPRDVTAEHPDDIRYYNSGLYTAIEAVTDIPSVQPERKRGKWIDKGTYCVCSLCQHTESPQYDGIQPIPRFTPFCSMCGAKMEEEGK